MTLPHLHTSSSSRQRLYLLYLRVQSLPGSPAFTFLHSYWLCCLVCHQSQQHVFTQCTNTRHLAIAWRYLEYTGPESRGGDAETSHTAHRATSPTLTVALLPHIQSEDGPATPKKQTRDTESPNLDKPHFPDHAPFQSMTTPHSNP